MPKTLLFVACAFLLATLVQAQDTELYLSSQQQPVRVTFGVVYQAYTQDDVGLSELSVPLTLAAPLGGGFGLTMVAHQATVEGDTLEGFSGVADVQIGLNYARRLPAGTLVINLGTNLPSGKRELTLEEFQTAVLLSQHYYSFRVPGFGQGFNVAPGFVWAFPLSDRVIAGLGATYQYRGAYQPLSTLDEEYDPGDEVTLTGGIDLSTGAAVNLSADVSYTLYTSDKLGGEEVLQAGDKLTVTAQLRSRLRRGDLHLVGRYRSVSKSSRLATLGSGEAELRVLPAQTLLRGVYRHQVSDIFTLGGVLQARIYDENVIFESASLFDVGLTVDVELARSVSAYTRGIYTLGDFTGFEAGGGLVLEL